MNAVAPSLVSIGFNSLVARAVAELSLNLAVDLPGTPQRIIEHHRDHVLIHDGTRSHHARLLPALTRSITNVAVGDWVLTHQDAHADWWLHARVPPYSELHRIAPDGARQVLVSNVDIAFLVMALDGDFNPRRLERYLALARSAGIHPVVVLTKADLCDEVDTQLDALAARLPASVDRHAVNATASETAERIAPYLGVGQTAVLLGSSGAGKSTLMNTLSGAVVQETAAVREDDSKGRHTTTSRVLRQLPAGACLIDTPGLRGLRLDIDAAALTGLFEDIDALASSCRFRDCAHENEPGCAVRAGVTADRLANYHKLRREIERDRASPLARRAEKARGKIMERAIRVHQRLNPGKK
jgi:ribosome biogenesis GTPase